MTQLQTNPTTNKGYLHLRIRGEIQIRRLQATLRDTATSMAYFEYLQNKFEWQTPLASTIHWPTIQLALSRFKASAKQILIKFIHEWLPLQDRYHVKSASIGQICPSCWLTKETAQHFLACNHTDRKTIWAEQHQSLEKHAIHHDISPTLHALYAYGLYTGRQTSTTITPSHDPSHQQINQAQMQLGWHQLFYGQQVTQWHTTCNTMHPTINSTHYYTKCLMLIWKAVIQIWTICNTHLYPTDQRLADRTQLHNTILQIFHDT